MPLRIPMAAWKKLSDSRSTPDPMFGAGLGKNSQAQTILFLPISHDSKQAAILRSQGWTTIAALSDDNEPLALGCTHTLNEDGTAQPL